MDARDFITVGMSAERLTTVTQDITVQHFVPSMPAVFATPMMILVMEMTSGDAIAPKLPQGWV
ncbi:thioesterase, partial [Rhodopseudomonas sp. BR0C11]|nr:thioesterase [Rhodopseudomonas sp. BR0C11]